MIGYVESKKNNGEEGNHGNGICRQDIKTVGGLKNQ
jgi:hypothetical protein